MHRHRFKRSNTQGFSGALLHQKKEKDWDWTPDYLNYLAKKLPAGQKLPLLHLAVWFCREKACKDSFTRALIMKRFVREYQFTDTELRALFELELVSNISEEDAFQNTPSKWHLIIEGYGTPKDVLPEGGAILQLLEFFMAWSRPQSSFYAGDSFERDHGGQRAWKDLSFGCCLVGTNSGMGGHYDRSARTDSYTSNNQVCCFQLRCAKTSHSGI